jgi:hypothetical protein
MVGTVVLGILAALMTACALGAVCMTYYEERIAKRKWGDVAFDVFVVALAVVLLMGW